MRKNRLTPLTAVYDRGCEICLAAVSWIRVFDRKGSVQCVAVQDGPLTAVHPALSPAACLSELHVVDADGRIDVGWQAVARIAEAIPAMWPLAALDRSAVTRTAAGGLYRYISANRHQLSACMGGGCAGAGNGQQRADTGPFWACYTLGMLLRLPLAGAAAAADQFRFVRDYARTFRHRIVVLDNVLELWFLGGCPADVVPLAFGERFTTAWYRGVLVDPGSVRMRPSLATHLRAAAGRGQHVAAVTATHAHEEHAGNLEWAARRAGAPVMLAPQITARLTPAAPIPRLRAAVIGQPPSLSGPASDAAGGIPVTGGHLQVLPAAGHSPDHVVLWDPQERVLLAGDCYLGHYFSAPNSDVDSRAWMSTLEHLLDLNVSVMVEGHGHVHTLRRDIPPVPGVVIRTDPRSAIERKLEFLTWLDTRIAEATAEGRSENATVAACFPWSRPWSWQRLAADEIARVTTCGEFSRRRLIRSFTAPRSQPPDPLPRPARGPQLPAPGGDCRHGTRARRRGTSTGPG